VTAFGITSLRSWYSVRGFAGLALLPLLAALAYSQNTQPEQAQSQEGGWVVVKDWSGGPGTMNTEEFTVPSDTWRIRYTTTSDERFGFMDIVLRDSTGQQVTAAYGLQSNDPGVKSGLVPVRKSGAFKLQISSYGVDWRIAAERPESR
jgi:hypothetical protein